MMEAAEQYNAKIESMKKYVPLLSKLITQLEEKNENSPQNLEKINQLKILQQQLCDTQPDILLEELSKCEKVLENLFELNENETDAIKIASEANEDNEEDELSSTELDRLVARKSLEAKNETKACSVRSKIEQNNKDSKEDKQNSEVISENEKENISTPKELDRNVSSNSFEAEKEATSKVKIYSAAPDIEQYNKDNEKGTQKLEVSNDIEGGNISKPNKQESHVLKIFLDDENEATDKVKVCSAPPDTEQNLPKVDRNIINNEIQTLPQTTDDNKEETQTVLTTLHDSNLEKLTNLGKPNCVESSDTSNIDEKVEDYKKFQDLQQNFNSAQEKTEDNNVETTNTSETDEKPSTKKFENLIESASNPFEKQDKNELGNLDESFEEANVEIIEFSENDENDSDDEESEGELIVPDEENPFNEQPYEDEEACNETEALTDSSKTTQELEVENENDKADEEPKEEEKTLYPTCIEQPDINDANNDDDEIKENESIHHTTQSMAVEIDNKTTKDLCQHDMPETANPKSNIFEEAVTEPKELNKPQEENKKASTIKADEVENTEKNIVQSEEQSTNIVENMSNQNGQKRTAAENIDDSIAKKQKVLDSETENEEPGPDPLNIDNENTATSTKDCASDHDNDNENDDVEIIEQRNSPILIDSDEEDPKIIEPIQKTERKRPAFAFKSTNPNKIRNLDNQIAGNKLLKINHSNISKRHIPLKPALTKTQLARPTAQPPPPRSQQTNFLSNIDLQPSQHNPRLFKTCIGQKTLLIPNAFYGSPSHSQITSGQNLTKNKLGSNPPSNAGPDAAHCRWLNNFLHHFCLPRNIAHNTSYLILQRALRQDDFERICRQRTEMNTSDPNINMRLLCQLRNIFYVDGDHKMQKLTYVGRKLCQLAFVNILDKTISLTTDSITREVTARTRISAATLEAARNEMKSTSTSDIHSVANTTLIEDSFTFQNSQIRTNSIIPPSNPITSTLQSSTSLRKKREDDTEYCPPREVSQLSTENQPRRSLRMSARSTSENLYSKIFTYSESDDEDTDKVKNDKANHGAQQKREKPNVTAATEAYIIQKRLAAKNEREKQAKSFETTFTDTVPENAGSRTSEQSKGTATENDSEVLVISDDDDDDIQHIPLQLAEPKLHLIHKASGTSSTKQAEVLNATDTRQTFSHRLQPMKNTINNEGKNMNTKIAEERPINTTDILSKIFVNGTPKNVSPEVHSMSRYNDYCLLCNRPVTRVVGHYVNTHPENEVFISRPPPKMARILLNNKLSVAAYDRLQNGLSLYIATCVFCEKKGSFTLPYWYQHFASHTGEYAYQCTGCGLRKPTRSQLSLHVRQTCAQNGSMVVTQQYDLRMLKIGGYACRLCNYTQLHIENMIKHFKNQHNMMRVDKGNMVNITLLEIPKSIAKGKQLNNSTTNKAQNSRFYVHGGNNEVFEIAEIDDNDYTGDIEGQPIVVNEAETDDSWYGGDPSVITNNTPYTGNNTDYEVKYE